MGYPDAVVNEVVELEEARGEDDEAGGLEADGLEATLLEVVVLNMVVLEGVVRVETGGAPVVLDREGLKVIVVDTAVVENDGVVLHHREKCSPWEVRRNKTKVARDRFHLQASSRDCALKARQAI
jgi:hypothetical protein